MHKIFKKNNSINLLKYYNLINNNHILYDLVYNPVETIFMKKGIEKGARVINGLKMLRYQAEKSWELWSKSD